MKNKILTNIVNGTAARQFLLLALLALVLVGAQRIGAATTWSDPTQDPPGGSIVAPVTVGTSSSTVQVVQGSLSMDTLGVFGSGFVKKILSVGTSTAPISEDTTLFVDGNVGAEEYCDIAGENCFTPSVVVNMLNDTDDGVSCPSEPNYTSMNQGPQTGGYFNQPVFGESGYYGASSLGSVFGATANENRWDVVSLPTDCKTNEGAGCIIRQKIYRRYALPGWAGWYYDKLYAVRDYEYRQDTSPTGSSADQLWWSSHNAAGNKKNGDTTSSNVTKAFSYLYLRDDANVTGGETDNDKLSAYDYARTYGMEIYFCTEASL